MNKLKQVQTYEPSVYEWEVYNNYLEYHEAIANDNCYVFYYDENNWKTKTIDGKVYMYYDRHRNKMLTLKAFNEMLKDCKIMFELRESDLIRTQYNSNCRFTDSRDTIDDVIAYMRDDNRSWLPQIYKEIEHDMAEAKKEYDTKMTRLNKEMDTLKDDEYLKTRITSHMRVTSKSAT